MSFMMKGEGNVVLVSGTVVSEPRFMKLRNGTFCKTKFAVAYESKQEESVGLLYVNIFGDMAHSARYIRKFDHIIVTGVLQKDEYNGHVEWECVCGGFEGRNGAFFCQDMFYRHMRGEEGKPVDEYIPKGAKKPVEKPASGDLTDITSDDIPF